MSWTDVFEALFGPDWIAPAAEVLGKNRRSIERWRSGRYPIPPEMEARIAAIRRPTRALGWAMRAAVADDYEERVRHLADPATATLIAKLRGDDRAA